jgi:transposase, IS5 family
MSFNQFILNEQYQKVKGLGDRLQLMKNEINWDPFIPLVKSVYHDDDKIGGRPHTDELIIIRSMILQGWYGLSDPELEFACNDRLSFRNFLNFTENIPDFTTIWKARERLKQNRVDVLIWEELQRQLDSKGYELKEGVIQDAAFIEADLGKKRHYNEKKAKKNDETIEYTKKQKQHQDQDATFSIKHNQVHYGYKSHIKMDIEYQLIRAIEVSTASLHDGEIDLATGDEIIYRDRGYTGKETRAKGNASMKRGKLGIKEKLRNKRISKKRVIGERPFSVVKNVFNGAKTKVKNLARVTIKEMFKFMGYNLYQLVTLRRKSIARAI